MKLLLAEALEKNNIVLDETSQAKLITYLTLLIKWNRVYNLTAITMPREMVYLHLIDSLIISPFLNGTQCLDVGTGAGLPGIPLAIIRPDTHWTLLDKNGKKTRFLRQVVAELDLTNIDIVHARTEDYQRDLPFDSIISRAFGSLALFASDTLHLLATNGILIAMKGKLPQDEIRELPQDITVTNTQQLIINGMDVERHIICLRPNT